MNAFCSLSNQSRMEEVSLPCAAPGGTQGWDGREVSGEPSSKIPAPPRDRRGVSAICRDKLGLLGSDAAPSPLSARDTPVPPWQHSFPLRSWGKV